MGLDLALNNALSGLKASQQSLSVLSQNIANANNTNYTRQSVVQSAVYVGSEGGNGVQVTGITRNIDQYISKSAITLSSGVSSTSTINSYYAQMQNYLGQPGADNSIDSYTSGFFNSLTQLANNPTQSSLKITAISSATTLSSQISGLASNLEGLRLNADTQISTAVDSVNAALKDIASLNTAIISAKNNNTSANGLEDQLDVDLKTVAANMDISYSTSDNGTVSISTSSGQQLLSGSMLYQVSYTPLASVTQLTDGTKISPINLQAVDSSGTKVGSPISLATGGDSSTITTTLTGGTIKGLLDVRDKLIPDTLTQLNNMASQITNAVNAIHNSGVSYPPSQTLTGQTLVSANSSTSWNGSVMIAALDANGNPVTSPYASDVSSGTGLTPLTLNLSTLNGGKPTVQNIVDQINNYYGTPTARAKLGDLSNIQLNSTSDSLVAGTGTYNFSLGLTNLSGKADGVVISGATITDHSGNPVSITSPATFPTTSVTSNGDNTTTSIPFTANMATAGAGPYTVTMQVQTTAADGTISSGTVTYTLNNATSGMAGDSYPASSATGSASLELPTSTQPTLVAKLVDANGTELPKDTNGKYIGTGYLQITGANSSTRAGIDELDSADLGANKAPATGEGFSQFYGLNNFFNTNGTNTNAALNMGVRSDLAANPEGMSLGQLTQSTAKSDGTARYTYEVGSQSNQAILALSTLATQSVNFKAAGSIPAVGTTFAGYAAQILGVNSSQASSATDDFNQATLIQQGFQDKDDSNRGVNIDEEMGNTIIFQNAYSANARVISVTKELFQDLLQVFQ